MLASVFDGTSTSQLFSSKDFHDDEPPSGPRSSLEHLVNHVFFPLHHPQLNDNTRKNAVTLVCAVHTAACAYTEYIDQDHRPHWLHITRMLENLKVISSQTQPQNMDWFEETFEEHKSLYQKHAILQLGGMRTRDILVFPGHSYKSAGIFRRGDHCTLYESLPISGYSTERRVVVPRQAIEIPNQTLDREEFLSNLATSLSGQTPRINRLLSDGRSVEPKCITKHAGPAHFIRRRKDSNPSEWSRSDTWFLIKVIIQLSLDRSPLGRGAYKSFILFFMCNLANYAVNASLPSILLHSMSIKMLQRFKKLGPSTPRWLCDTVFDVCAIVSRTLDQRQQVQATQYSSQSWGPSRLDFTKDIQSCLPSIHEYFSISRANCGSDLERVSFLSDTRLRGTLDEFLSNPGCLLSRPNVPSRHDDIHTMLHDVERAVSEDIDDWVAHVTDVDNACKQLADLAYRYQSFVLNAYHPRRNEYDFGHLSDPDHLSTMFLTTMELWIALDKLVIKEFPVLSDYSPEIPIDLLRRPLLRDGMSIYRLCRANQYLVARHDRAHPGWSVFSSNFTKDSFPCRYYDSSLDLQYLKTRMKPALPSDPLYAKVVLFELQCPPSFDTWRSITCQISRVGIDHKYDTADIRVCDIPDLKLHTLRRRCSIPLYSSPSPRPWARLYYVYEGFPSRRFRPAYKLSSGLYKDSGLQQYLGNTKHTSNEVLAAQVDCHPNLSSHEFIAFAHLRSGASLQWINILRELRSRSLNFRHQEVYLLLAQASTEVGPLDRAGELLWHQEIQNTSFCHSLLDEIESLFVDIGVGSLDGPAMATISLLASVLASRSSGDVPDRAIRLLQNVRRKTFNWVHELLYNVRKSPTNKESLELLRDMAAVCRSTFDVGSNVSRKLLHSPQDIEIALSCAMLICTLVPAFSVIPAYSQVLLNRDCRLSFDLARSLRDAIQADPSDFGIDRAVQTVWPGYRPSPRRWEPLHSPDSQWLVCETTPTRDRRSQTVHVNLLDGSLLVDGKPIGNKLPSDVTSDPMYSELFGSRNLMVVASDLPGMDFVTTSVIHDHHIHFSARNDNLNDKRVLIRIESKNTNDIFELIPREILQADLPRSLTQDHVHWLNLSTTTIEIRPVGEPWKQSSNNWTIHSWSLQPCLTRGGEFLVDKQSPTWTMVSNCFKCLEDPENLIISVSPVDTTHYPSAPRLSVALPRYGLSFFVNNTGHLESRDFKHMVYDEDQYIGTLFGLVNKLVLRPKAQPEMELIPKRILVPYSGSFDQRGHAIHARLPSSGLVQYYTYEVDGELGCLKGTVSLESRLYLARLHALTGNGCRPDPLTGRTGVEEAISIVWLAGTRQATYKQSPALSDSFQMHLALETIQGRTDGRVELHSEEVLLRESYLFPSEVAACLQLSGSRKGSFALLDQLLGERPAPDLPERTTLPDYDLGCRGLSRSPDIDPLRRLFSSLRTNGSTSPFQSQYISRLHDSAHHLQKITDLRDVGDCRNEKLDTETLRKHYVQSRICYTESLDSVKKALGPKTEFERIFDQCGQWPRLTPFVLFRCLASTSPIKLPENWKKCLISLAVRALDVQRARRLLQFALENLEEELYKELENKGCDRWYATQHTDWLLIQLQGNFLIRRVQTDIAKEMMYPRSGKNAVMQVNMGEGKTSVIIPICAVALADSNQLVRVIVSRALIPQTLQILTNRLCGLVNKPVFHATFSRDEIWLQDKGKDLHALVCKCRDARGIVVMQPEHVLSLKLACVETHLLENEIRSIAPKSIPKRDSMLTSSLTRLLGQDTHVTSLIARIKRWYPKHETPEETIRSENAGARENSINHRIAMIIKSIQTTVLELQRFLDAHARDILDESDDILRPQFQLIYAIGHQHPFEGSPDRWLIVQRILQLVKRHTFLLSTHDSRTIRCDNGSPGSFPHIHILRADGGEELVSLIAQDVLDGRLFGISVRSDQGLGGAIREFILRKDIDPDTVKTVENYARQSTSWNSLLLLRGLLAHRLLLFALTQRRWRVNYGLDLSSPPRTLLAIPYRAKDMPAETAEFGHPDIAIMLTCLSYYYGGLDEDQLRISFELLLQQDDPSSEYALWIEDRGSASVPSTLQKLSGVNIRSFEQWDKYLFPLFTRNKRAIDPYLSKIVFPNHAKEFPQRISGSYWDIAEQKNHLITGFAGTNDGQYLLPTSIIEDDPDHLHQAGTNARVLAYLLQPENASYMVTTDRNGERWNTLKLLKKIVAQSPEIRVLLDVGAQILDLSNLQLVKAWLAFTPSTDTAGAIFFNDDDELMALARNGTILPLTLSPLAQQLHRCVAYLDDAHTRGTDLQFPRDFRAAVTLGHRVTKDRLVQGCMRMRKLGRGHSVMFFAPHEVDQRIRGLVAKDSANTPVTTADILHWAIHETWQDIQRQAPYWAQQGMTHQYRYEAWSHFCRNETALKRLADAWVQPELKSIADMYKPCHSTDTTCSTKLSPQIRERCENLGVLSLRDVRMDEGQEREVSREIERERQAMEMLPVALPAAHLLHPDVVQFVRTGVVPSSWSDAFRHVFAAGGTAASRVPTPWSSCILATADFCRTTRAGTEKGDCLRPVQWVVSGKMGGQDALVLFSPYEADRLMPEIRNSTQVHLHLYVPRMARRMKPSDDLRLYSVPPVPPGWAPPWTLIDQLNVFAGQLFLRDHASCVRLCRFLGVRTEERVGPEKSGRTTLRHSDAASDAEQHRKKEKTRFEGTTSSMAMQSLAARHGMDFAGTHMGRILDGWPLAEEDFTTSPPDTIIR